MGYFYIITKILLTLQLKKKLTTIRQAFFFFVSFLSQTFTNHKTAGEEGWHFFNSSLPLPPASQTLRHQPGNYCKELTSIHSQQPDSNREPLVSERNSLTTKLRALKTRLFTQYYIRLLNFIDSQSIKAPLISLRASTSSKLLKNRWPFHLENCFLLKLVWDK